MYRTFNARCPVAFFFVTAIHAVKSLRQLVVSQKRFRSKLNIQKPQKLFYERALVTEFVTPFIPMKNPPVPIWEKCNLTTKKKKEDRAPHPYLRIVANECLQRYRDSKMTGIFHKNSMSQEEEFEFAVVIHKHKMVMKKYGMGISRVAFKNTEFEAALKLFSVSSLTVFSPEVNVEALRKAAKKIPQLILIAGIIDGKLLSCKDFLKYGKMSLTDARSQLVHTLQAAGGVNLNRQLNHHQSTLVSRLQQIANNEVATEENVSDTQEANIDVAESDGAKPE